MLSLGAISIQNSSWGPETQNFISIILFFTAWTDRHRWMHTRDSKRKERRMRVTVCLPSRISKHGRHVPFYAAYSDAFSLCLRSFSMYTPVTTIRSTMSFPASYISSILSGRELLLLLIITHWRRWKRATGVLAESFTKSYDDPGQPLSV